VVESDSGKRRTTIATQVEVVKDSQGLRRARQAEEDGDAETHPGHKNSKRLSADKSSDVNTHGKLLDKIMANDEAALLCTCLLLVRRQVKLIASYGVSTSKQC
jgi:hypothetical protein